MAKKIEVESKTEKLRALRLAHEAARKEAGTWGEMTVGEIVHEATRSVFVQVWKGLNRPDPFRQHGARQVGIGATEWLAMTAWVNARRGEGQRRNKEVNALGVSGGGPNLQAKNARNGA